MEYQSILKKVEEQQKERILSEKLFRYNGLLQAIDFFSQKLNFDQVVESAFDFVNELLMTSSCAVFAVNNDKFQLKKFKGDKVSKFELIYTDEIRNLAMFHGTIISGKDLLERYFSEELIEEFNLNFAIPMIIENYIYGMILVSNSTDMSPGSDDSIIAESLMKLINNALENYKRYEELQKANKELDEKIFNLFAINQSSKALLSELDIDLLNSLSVDVFSELTQSATTAFIVYDEKHEQFILKGFRDVFRKIDTDDIHLVHNYSAIIDVNKVILDLSVEKDKIYFNNLFINGIDKISGLNAKYIILLCKNAKLLGFVTLGETVTGIPFNKSIFELIESLAASTYTAFSNAKLFDQVNEQKQVIKNKLDKLTMLNNLMRNINCSSTVDTLIEMTMKTLEVSFGIEKALFGIYSNDKEGFTIKGSIHINSMDYFSKLEDSWKDVMIGKSVVDVGMDKASIYFDEKITKQIGDSAGVLIFPIFIERLDIEIFGYLAVFGMKNVNITDEETMLIIDNIAGHISPVLANLTTIEEQARFLLPNYIEMFKVTLKERVNEALECELPLQVVEIRDSQEYLFGKNTLIDSLKKKYSLIFPFSNNIIFMILEDIEENPEEAIINLTGSNMLQIKSFELRKDFSTYQEFYEQFK